MLSSAHDVQEVAGVQATTWLGDHFGESSTGLDINTTIQVKLQDKAKTHTHTQFSGLSDSSSEFQLWNIVSFNAVPNIGGVERSRPNW